MESKALFQPRKRTDLNDWLDKIMSLKNAINFKIQLEKQIEFQKEMIDTLSKWTLLDRLLSLVLSNRQRLKRLNRKLKMSQLTSTNENLTKQVHVYHRNEILLEEDFDEIYDELEERYVPYLRMLMEYYSEVEFGSPPDSEMPDKDIKILVTKYQTEPPSTKIEKLTFYLTMEELLYRCQRAN